MAHGPLSRLVLLLAWAGVFALAGKGDAPAFAADPPLSVTVTSAGDSVEAGESVCPDVSKCTLRRAIELVNADETVARYTISFNQAVFPAGEPATITVLETPLPEVTRALVTIDASGAGVVIDGSELPLEDVPPPDGLRMSGTSAVVRGLAVRHFTGACIWMGGAGAAVGGDRGESEGNTAGDCGQGIEVAGASAVVQGNDIGFAAGGAEAPVTTALVLSGASGEAGATSAARRNIIGNATTAVRVTGPNSAVAGNDIGVSPGGLAAPVGTGVHVLAQGVTAGGSTSPAGNFITNAQVAVVVGGTGVDPFAAVLISRNVIGRGRGGDPGPAGSGIYLRQPSSGTRVQDNTFAAVDGAAVRIAATTGGKSVTLNQVRGNRFESVGGMALDLNDDGIANPNDPGDADAGANGLLNHPVITKATQAKVAGTAGASCPGCTVDLYMVAHTAGGEADRPTFPVLAGSVLTDSQGLWAIDSPPLVPGNWVAAIVTDPAGNTSEFGPAARVGSGVVQCGNVTLAPGWNHSGFFGAVPLSLGAAYPAELGLPSRVTAIYRLEDGTASFSRWLSNGGPTTLAGLEPGGAYWFLAGSQIEVPGGFALSFPLPVELKAGWNDFVYIGATADVRDALASIAGKYREVYRFANVGGEAHWSGWGTPEAPDWAREFSEMQACGAYQVFVTEDVTLIPLQP
ncbi:MAG: hypothetical protein HY875_03200 [Chloroflexi bacterium]|nr:hypothetical protein [Chloroflexota bacterium]